MATSTAAATTVSPLSTTPSNAAASPFDSATAKWTPPPLDAMNFASNCSVAGKWLVEFQTDAGIFSTLTYLEKSMPESYRQDPPPIADMTAWFMQDLEREVTNESLVFHMIYTPMLHCQEEFCQSLDWGGNPDISGIGVSTIRYLQEPISSRAFLC